MSKKNNVKTLDQFVDEQYGKKGTSKRDKFEKGYETFIEKYSCDSYINQATEIFETINKM
jgi:hypothetical protein